MSQAAAPTTFDLPRRRLLKAPGAGIVGGGILLLIALLCVPTLFWTLPDYDNQNTLAEVPAGPSWSPPLIDPVFEEHVVPHVGPALWRDHLVWVMGTDTLGRSMLVRCLLGGAISLGIGASAAIISVFIGTTWGAVSGYAGGWVDGVMMRFVDVMYGLPYILLVVLMSLVMQQPQNLFDAGRWCFMKPALIGVGVATAVCVVAGVVAALLSRSPGEALAPRRLAACLALPAAWFAFGGALMLFARFLMMLPESIMNLLTLLIAIGGVSWLTLARVVRGQVLSLREQPFIEAARAAGVPPTRIFFAHLLPNLIGPIVVYTTLTVPAAVLQESFLSFLGIGVHDPLPSWGNLATQGVEELQSLRADDVSVSGWSWVWPYGPTFTLVDAMRAIDWWLLVWPCLLLGSTLMALNFLGDALRARFDPQSREAT